MKPIRVLHVLGAMNRGGVETWLMHVLRHTNRESVEIDFLVHTDQAAAYDSELLAQGSKLLRCPNTANPLLYAKRFLQLLRQNGPFDVLHSHVHHFSGFSLTLGRIAGIPVRIPHSHSDTMAGDWNAHLVRRIYLVVMKRLALANCTHGLAVSEEAARALFGTEWKQDRRLSVLSCGIDLAPFRIPVDSAAIRAEFGFSPDDLVFGHAGRFSPVKNHLFFLEVAACISSHEPRAKFLLVGDGPLRSKVEERARSLKLEGKLVFAGIRSDIPRLMVGAIDVFLMPSVHEGLPLVLMEAQAAGLRCLASDVVTQEAVVNPAIVHRLPLAVGPREWARTACEIAEQPRFDLSAAVGILNTSRFNIERGVQQMCDIYLNEKAQSRKLAFPSLEADRKKTQTSGHSHLWM